MGKERLDRMLANINDKFDKTEGMFFYDILNALELELQLQDEKIKETEFFFDIEKLAGADLEKRVYQKTGEERKPSTKAVAELIIKGVEGSEIFEGMLCSTDGIDFEIKENKIIGKEEVEVRAECTVFGAVGNVPAGSIKRFPVTIAGLTEVTNAAPATGGYDTETDESLKKRYYEKVRKPAISGNSYHYFNWASEVTGVGEVKVIPLWAGPGTVRVVITDSQRLPPDAGLVEEVKAKIEDERPLGAEVTVAGATVKNVIVSLKIIKKGEIADDLVKEKIKVEIENFLKEISFSVNFVSLAMLGKVILEISDILDVQELKINGLQQNLELEFEEVPVLQEVVIDGNN